MKHLKTFEAMFDFLKKSKPTQPAKKEDKKANEICAYITRKYKLNNL